MERNSLMTIVNKRYKICLTKNELNLFYNLLLTISPNVRCMLESLLESVDEETLKKQLSAILETLNESEESVENSFKEDKKDFPYCKLIMHSGETYVPLENLRKHISNNRRHTDCLHSRIDELTEDLLRSKEMGFQITNLVKLLMEI